MNSIVVWAHSYCRSTLAFYRGLGNAFGVPLKVLIWKENAKLRTNVGFTEDEFSDMDITFIGNNYELVKQTLDDYKSSHHIFGAYQSIRLYQKIILEAHKRKYRIAIASEAPCNMMKGYQKVLKDVYIHLMLPIQLKKYIRAADFIINYSGYDKPLIDIGWPKEKIISCGYYSPRITNANLVKRNSRNWENFNILLTGIHQWHRSPILLLKALKILKEKGLSPKCNITQDGPLLKDMKKYVSRNHLDNVKFLGFVAMEELRKLYENCSVYIGTGNHEPWGMRLNDALQCGSPLIVNKGMGGVKLVQEYGCGLSFEKNNPYSLANALEKLIRDKKLYCEIADKAFNANEKISPDSKAKEIVDIIRKNFNGW